MRSQSFLIAPDSFKGTISSFDICEVIEERIHRILPDAKVKKIPIADGGEGSVDCLVAAVGGKKKTVEVCGPRQGKVSAAYGILDDHTAVIEMAAAAGLPLVKSNPSAADTTTYGVGELIADAIHEGCKKILLCIGGSATNDGGCGMASALGVRFYDDKGTFVPTGRTLLNIRDIDLSGAELLLNNVEVTVLCDVTNPLCGETGASVIFGPQKGATPDEIKLLDRGLEHLADLIAQKYQINILNLPGAGAAGGMGGGSVAFLKARLVPGIEAVLDTVKFDELLSSADLVITGEGRIDSQSAHGKVISGITARAKKCGVPVAAIVGDIGKGAEELFDFGLSGIFTINRRAVPFSEAKKTTKADLAFTAENLIRFILATK